MGPCEVSLFAVLYCVVLAAYLVVVTKCPKVRELATSICPERVLKVAGEIGKLCTVRIRRIIAVVAPPFGITLGIFILLHLTPYSAHSYCTRWAFPVFLTQPWAVSSRDRDELDDWLDFRSRTLPLVGRDREFEELEVFLRSEGKFQYWWMIGGPGSGKSRLALEWARRHSATPFYPFSVHGYDVGFLDTPPTSLMNLPTWRPRRPTIVVIDDAAERVDDIKDFIATVGSGNEVFSYPVRVLLVERSIPEQLEDMDVLDAFHHYDWNRPPLELDALGMEGVEEIFRSLKKSRAKYYPPEATKASLTSDVARNVVRLSDGMPLLIIFLLDNYLEKGSIDFRDQYDVVLNWVRRAEAKIRRHEIDDSCFPLIALATFSRPLEWDKIEDSFVLKECDERGIKRKTDQVLGISTSDRVSALRPDLIGEGFVLRQFERLPDPKRKAFVELAWQVEPYGAGPVITRIWQDFPEHPMLSILNMPPSGRLACVRWLGGQVGLTKYTRERVPRLMELLENMKVVHLRFPQDRDIQYQTAQAFVNIASRFREWGTVDELSDALDVLGEIGYQFPNDDPIQLEIAKGIVNGLSGLGRLLAFEEMEARQVELEKIVALRWKDVDFQRVFANGIKNMFNHYLSNERLDDVDRMVFNLKKAAIGSEDSGVDWIYVSSVIDLLTYLHHHGDDNSAGAVRWDFEGWDAEHIIEDKELIRRYYAARDAVFQSEGR